MPAIRVVFYRDGKNGPVPARKWIAAIPSNARDRLNTNIERLQEMGHELRRPHCENLRDSIYELREGGTDELSAPLLLSRHGYCSFVQRVYKGGHCSIERD